MIDDGDDDFPIDVLSQLRQSDIDWDNREALQSRWTPHEKGWRIQVEWKRTPFGLGAFAAQDVTQGTILRVGKSRRNLIIFSSKQDIVAFLGDPDHPQYHPKVRYLSDYLFGNFHPETQEFTYGILVPGFGTNHSDTPNVQTSHIDGDGSNDDQVISMVAVRDIRQGEELRNSYHACGPAPDFVKEFSEQHQVSLVFPGCNDFVV